MNGNTTKRILMSLLGVLICAISVGLFKHAALGVDPFQTFMAGLDKLLPIQFGTLYVIVNIILLLFSLVFNRKMIGIATFINLLFFGYITQFSLGLFQMLILNPSFVIRIILLLAAVVVMCFGSAFYMTAEMGVSTYDALAITMADKWNLGQFKYIRIFTDVICVVLGCIIFLAGGGNRSEIPSIAGIGTVVTAFCMGPLIDYFNRKVAKPFLNR